jgi:hypothetical protein
MKRVFFTLIALALAVGLSHAALGATISTPGARSPEVQTNAAPTAKTATTIRIRIRNKVLTARVIDSRTARDFVSLLPLTLRMDDLFGREKTSPLPRALANGGKRTHTVAAGDIVYWSPGPDVAIIYRHASPGIPDPGDIVLAKISSEVKAFDGPGSVRVRIERAR